MLRRMRGRFGISAPRVAVRTHIPWYLRTAGLTIVVILSIAMSVWAYDEGRSKGEGQITSTQIVDELRLAKSALEDEVARLRSLLTVSESSLQIEQATQLNLSEKNSLLAEENARLKEELVVFGRLAKLDRKAIPAKQDLGNISGDVSIDRLSARPDSVTGRYRFSFMLALLGPKRGKETKLNLQIVVSPRGGSATDRIELPRQNEKNIAQYAIALRNFRRIEGGFEVPVDTSISALEFRIFEAGVLKASKSLSL